MKKNLNVILSAILGVVSLIAIATPIGVGISSQLKIDDLTNQTNAWKEKRIAGLPPTEAFTTIVNKEYATEAAALTELNAVEDKKTLFTVVNENGNELKDVWNNLKIGANFSFSHQPTDQPLEVMIPVTDWGTSTDYYIPLSLQSQVSFIWGGNTITVKNDSFRILNAIDDVSTATDAPTLAAAFNADKLGVAQAINNGDKIEITNISVAPADPVTDGYDIRIFYNVKEGQSITFPPASIDINGFKIVVPVSLVDNYSVILNRVEGVNGATNANDLQNALNADAAAVTVLSAIENGDKINLGEISVTGPTETGFNVVIPYTAKAEDVLDGNLVIDDFKITATPAFQAQAQATRTLNSITNVNSATNENELQNALNNQAAKEIILTAIDNHHIINDLGQVNVSEITATGYNISIDYTAKFGYDVSNTTLRLTNFEIMPSLKVNAHDIINEIEGMVDISSTELGLNTLLQENASKAKVATAIYNSDRIEITNIVVTGIGQNGFSININYTAKAEANILDGVLNIRDFEIDAILSWKPNHLAALNRIAGVSTATDAAALAAALNANRITVENLIVNANKVWISNVNVTDSSTGEGYRITINYSTTNGVNIVDDLLTIENFIIS